MQDFYELEKYKPQDYPFVAATIGCMEMQPGIDRKNGWDLNQFLWVTEGEGIFKVNEETFQLSKGQGLFTRKNISHAYAPAGDSFSTSWVTFLNGDDLLSLYNVGDWFIFDVPDFLEKSRGQLYSLCHTTKSLTLRAAHGYVWAAELLEAVTAHELSITERIQQFLEQHCSEPITLDQICAEIGMDRFALCKYYRKETGETVMDTLKSIRIRRAKRLLRYGIDPVSEVCRQCGYDGVSYFIKTFRKVTGFTPLQYRQKHK